MNKRHYVVYIGDTNHTECICRTMQNRCD